MFGNIFEGKKVFLTGHTGFKGSWLCAWLLKLGAKVTGYALSPTYPESHFELLGLAKRIHHIEGDVRDRTRLVAAIQEAQPDIVFHLAAQALVRPSYKEPADTFETNVMGGVNLIEGVRACESVRVLVFITSDKCYRNVNWEWGYRETDALGGHDPYSASKACAELVFNAYWHSFLKGTGRLSAATTRAGNVIGGGDWATDRLIPDCVRALRQGETIEIRNPQATRPWQHVLEPLGGYLHIARRLSETTPGEIHAAWNFGPGHNANRPVEHVVRDVITHWGSGEYAVRPDPSAPREDHWLQLNTDRASNYLHWDPVWDYPESIQQTVEWYRAFHARASIPEVTDSQIDAYVKRWQELGRP
jgi:CDP-glucose 4,6-dehydratase